jgi:hypothetical protein
LDAQFFTMAQALGKPRGLHWVECDWLDTVTFGRDLKSRMLTAFARVNIRIEDIEGDVEGPEAVGMIRDATALFHYQRTGGRDAPLLRKPPLAFRLFAGHSRLGFDPAVHPMSTG